MQIQEFFSKTKKICLVFFVIFCVSYLIISLRQRFVGDDAFLLDYPEVVFKGDLSIDREMAIADIKDVLNKHNLLSNPKSFSVDVDDVKDDFLQLSWIKNIAVVKEYPSKLLLVIEPKNIIAYMFNNDEYFPVDEMGNIIPISVDYKSGLIISGEGANENLLDFLAVLKKYPKIMDKVVYLQFINGLRWNVFLYGIEDGIVIKLDNEDFEMGLQKIERLDDYQDLLKRNISEIDVRDINRLLVKQRN